MLVNVHLEAYTDQASRDAETRVLVDLITAEHEAGNYVIAGGAFNRSFPGADFPVVSTRPEPDALSPDLLPAGWTYAHDPAVPTARLSDKPWDGAGQVFGIDGFVVSPNVEVVEVRTVDLGFEHSDHNPVRLVARLSG
ncbi:MAG: hypothetical protein LBK95_05645 [Bifidobacteriaceae bacterium]|nr:hypothetical protein [Bifidobacteriaceae bacterium]